MIGQMMEPVEFKEQEFPQLPAKDWATDGCKGRKPNIVNSLYLNPVEEEQLNRRLEAKYERMKRDEVLLEEYNTDKPYRAVLVAYGTTARVCKTAIKKLADDGIDVALLRPITLFPFPSQRLGELADRAEFLLSVEMSMGQMLEDIRLATSCGKPVHFYGRQGGLVPSPEEVADEVKRLLGAGKEGE
jgi:2-oxoglutarate ferredoxin oxidoreductase subunit alpha